MVTLNDTPLELIKKGIVDVEEAYSKAVSRQEFAELLQRNGLQAPELNSRVQKSLVSATQKV